MYWDDVEYCRWCGKEVKPKKTGKRFYYCCNAHKMAFHRAYKRYVTQSPAGSQAELNHCVTRKRRGQQFGQPGQLLRKICRPV